MLDVTQPLFQTAIVLQRLWCRWGWEPFTCAIKQIFQLLFVMYKIYITNFFGAEDVEDRKHFTQFFLSQKLLYVLIKRLTVVNHLIDATHFL